MDTQQSGGRVPSPEEFGEHIARLNAESVDNRRRLERLEENYALLRIDVQQLTNSQTETKTLVGTVITRFDGFEGRILTIFGQMTADSAKLLQSMTKNSNAQAQGWQRTILEVIKLTVAALIGYAPTKGGG